LRKRVNVIASECDQAIHSLRGEVKAAPAPIVSPDGIFRRLPRLLRKARKKPGRNASGAKY
jgi:hypothetical protein